MADYALPNCITRTSTNERERALTVPPVSHFLCLSVGTVESKLSAIMDRAFTASKVADVDNRVQLPNCEVSYKQP